MNYNFSSDEHHVMLIFYNLPSNIISFNCFLGVFFSFKNLNNNLMVATLVKGQPCRKSQKIKQIATNSFYF
jgi:hypothetical protein